MNSLQEENEYIVSVLFIDFTIEIVRKSLTLF